MAAVGSCSAAGCTATAGGACLEGFSDLGKCPNYSLNEHEAVEDSIIDRESAVDKSIEIDTDSLEQDQHIILHSGEALAVADAHQISGELPTTVVMLVGMVKSGKTTVLAEIYEKYRQGSFANHLFAGTQTVMGFERICHYARAASNGQIENTARTNPTAENNLLHLDLVDRDSRARKRLLVSDLSGEHFERGIQTDEQLRAIPYLSRADHFVLFADTKKLYDPTRRQSLLNQMLVLLRGCAEQALVQSSCCLTVVFSRHDLASDIDVEDQSNEAFLALLRTKITARARDLVDAAPTFLELAARPEEANIVPYGLEELLTSWLVEPEGPQPCIPRISRSAKSRLRQLDSMVFKEPCDE